MMTSSFVQRLVFAEDLCLGLLVNSKLGRGSDLAVSILGMSAFCLRLELASSVLPHRPEVLRVAVPIFLIVPQRVLADFSLVLGSECSAWEEDLSCENILILASDIAANLILVACQIV